MEGALSSGGPDSGDRGETLGETPPAGITADSRTCDNDVEELLLLQAACPETQPSTTDALSDSMSSSGVASLSPGISELPEESVLGSRRGALCARASLLGVVARWAGTGSTAFDDAHSAHVLLVLNAAAAVASAVKTSVAKFAELEWLVTRMIPPSA